MRLLNFTGRVATVAAAVLPAARARAADAAAAEAAAAAARARAGARAIARARTKARTRAATRVRATPRRLRARRARARAAVEAAAVVAVAATAVAAAVADEHCLSLDLLHYNVCTAERTLTVASLLEIRVCLALWRVRHAWATVKWGQGPCKRTPPEMLSIVLSTNPIYT
jgi:hypothetical protein